MKKLHVNPYVTLKVIDVYKEDSYYITVLELLNSENIHSYILPSSKLENINNGTVYTIDNGGRFIRKNDIGALTTKIEFDNEKMLIPQDVFLHPLTYINTVDFERKDINSLRYKECQIDFTLDEPKDGTLDQSFETLFQINTNGEISISFTLLRNQERFKKIFFKSTNEVKKLYDDLYSIIKSPYIYQNLILDDTSRTILFNLPEKKEYVLNDVYVDGKNGKETNEIILDFLYKDADILSFCQSMYKRINEMIQNNRPY